MKKIQITLLMLLLLFILNNSSFAQAISQNQFGYVNVADAMLLHPTMKYFDPISKRFKLEAIMKGEDAEKKAEENKVNYLKELNKLENDLKELEAKRIEIEETFYERNSHLTLSADKLKKLSDKEKDSYNEKLAKLSSKYFTDSAEVKNKIFFAKENIKSHKESSIYNGLTNAGETDRLLSLMLDDIYEAINEVAKNKNLPFIFNSSMELTLFRDGFMTHNNPMVEFFTNLKENLATADGKKITGAYINSWLEQKNNAFENIRDKRLGNFVISGGYDLTPEVISHIYTKFKVGSEQIDFINEYYKKIVNNKK